MTMTLEQVRDWHLDRTNYVHLPITNKAHKEMADAIRAHLLSQDAEIADLIGKRDFLLRHYNLAESRLAAANSLLRFMRTRFDAYMDDSDRASIEAHLSENTHDRA